MTPPPCFGIRGYCSYVKYGRRYNSLLVGRRGTVCRGGAPPHCTMERLEQGQRNFYIFLNPLQGRAAEQTIKLERFRFFRKTPETDRKKDGNFSRKKSGIFKVLRSGENSNSLAGRAPSSSSYSLLCPAEQQ